MATNLNNKTVQIASPFDLVFKSNDYHRKNPNVRPKEEKDFENIEESLYDFVENARLFPLDFVMNSIIEELDSSIEVSDPTNRFRLNFSSFGKLLSNPNLYVKSSLEKYKLKRKWIKIGGFVSGSMDGALFSLLGHKVGLSHDQNRAIGKIFSSPLSDIDMKVPSLMIQEEVLKERENAEILVKSILIEDYGIDEKKVDLMIQNNKLIRTDNIDPRQHKDTIKNNLEIENLDDELIENISIVLNDSSRITILHNAAKNIALKKLSNAVDKDPIKNHSVELKLKQLENDSGVTPGLKLERNLNTIKYIFEKGYEKDILKGDFDKIGLVEPTKLRIVEDGKETGEFATLMLPKNTLLSKSLGNLYYFHPKNFIKNFILKGDG